MTGVQVIQLDSFINAPDIGRVLTVDELTMVYIQTFEDGKLFVFNVNDIESFQEIRSAKYQPDPLPEDGIGITKIRFNNGEEVFALCDSELLIAHIKLGLIGWKFLDDQVYLEKFFWWEDYGSEMSEILTIKQLKEENELLKTVDV